MKKALQKKRMAAVLTAIACSILLSGCRTEIRGQETPQKIGDHYVIYDWDDFYATEEEIAREQEQEYERLKEEYQSQQEKKAQKERAEELAKAQEKEENPTFTMLDVGQGLCLFAKSGLQTLLYDTGSSSSEDRVLSLLEEKGITHLDYLVLSHPDEDHIGNAATILANIPVDCVILRQDDLKDKETSTAKELRHVLSNTDATMLEPEAGSVLPFGNAEIEILGPISSYEEVNNNSIVIAIEYGEKRILIAGDSELEAEEELVNNGIRLNADVYVVSHHGSYNGTSEGFLKAMNPKYALISCGLGNDYGHPHASAMALLANETDYLYRTDLQGDITFCLDATGLYFEKPPCEDYSCGDDLNGESHAASD